MQDPRAWPRAADLAGAPLADTPVWRASLKVGAPRRNGFFVRTLQPGGGFSQREQLPNESLPSDEAMKAWEAL